MKGYVALTDHDWYRFLRSNAPWDEVNFWQPRGGTLLNPPTGTPFFFKLHSAHGSRVVGFGEFSWRSRLPAWMAWDCFGAANGAHDRNSFLIGLAQRRGQPVDPTGNFPIGCLLIARPVFFAPEESVSPPADWPRSGIQQGKSYDLDQGEGLRLYAECRARVSNYPEALPAAAGASVHGIPDRRLGKPYEIKPRLGQGGFRVAVTDAYGRACAITSEHSLPVLEAAHIRPFADGGDHDVSNGLLLRADIHRLFDQGLVTVTADHQFLVSRRLEADYNNGRTYYELQRRVKESGRIRIPSNAALQPNRDLLDWHSKERFVT